MMKKLTVAALALMSAGSLMAQQPQDKASYTPYEKGYYHKEILTGIEAFQEEQKEEKPFMLFKMDLEGRNLPTDPAEYKQVWHNKPISQGNTGTCWCFASTSFYESEIKRNSGIEVKLSEMYPVYWEYVQRAQEYVRTRGNTHIGEGSETNAVTRTYEQHGAVPMSLYTGLRHGQEFHTHQAMFKEINSYLEGVKERNAWNEAEVVATVKSILNHHMGEPPTQVTWKGKTYTPKQWMNEVLKLQPTEYVDLMSLMEKPYYQQVEYDVPDNWWNSNVYYNVPLEDYMKGLKSAIKDGYTVAIGGDVSEAGFHTGYQVAMVPTFDIPSEYIDESARQMRFNNRSTTDDHAMHLVGWQEHEGDTWFLVKDSGSGSRNCGEECKEFGYYFFHEDYIKLKMMSATVHKDAVKQILKKFKA